MLAIDDLGGLDRRLDDVVESKRPHLEGPLVVEPSEQQQVVDQLCHPRGFVFDRAHRVGEVLRAAVGAATEQLRVAADRGQRGAELMRGVGETAA